MLTLRHLSSALLLVSLTGSAFAQEETPAIPQQGGVVIRAVASDGEGGGLQTFESFSVGEPGVILGGLGAGGLFTSNDPLSLLQQAQFGDELTILDDQKKEIQALAKEVRKMRSEVFSQLRQPNGRIDPAKLQEQMAAMREAVQNKTQEGLERILLPPQRARLDEIRTQMELQRGGVAAVQGGRLAELIGLTDEQKKELAKKQSDYQKRLKKGIEELKVKLQKDILSEVLTDAQVKKLEEIKGDRFEVKQTSLRERLEALRKKAEDRDTEEK